MRIVTSLQAAFRKAGEIFRPANNFEVNPDPRAKKRLQWLLDAPLFADEKLIGNFFDAVVRPEFEVQSREVGSSTEDVRRRLTGGEATAGFQMGISFIGSTNITAKGKHEWERGRKQMESHKLTEVAVNSVGRRLEEIATLYVSKYPERVVFLDGDGTITTFDGRRLSVEELERVADEPPRMLVFVEFTPNTPIMPMACELLSGRVVLLHERYNKKVFPPDGEAAQNILLMPIQPERRALLIGKPSRRHSSPARQWRSSRVPATQTRRSARTSLPGSTFACRWGVQHTLHLHCVPDGNAHTGVFGYNFVRRGFRQGVRIVGTLKAGLDVNALAIFDR